MRLGALTATLLLAAASVMPMASLHAAAPSKTPVAGKQEKAALLKADQIEYDTNTSVTTATGHVEVDYNQQILMADKVIYDSNADKVTALGHVTLMQPDGTVAFSDHAVLTDQMKDGVLDGFAALIGKTGRLAGTYATRKGGVRTVATRAAYTNCKVCNQPGQRTPLWQVEAARVIYDEPAHRIYYKDAVIEAFGVPIFYTPLFTNSDPTVRRSSGILLPDVGDSSTLGWYARIPIYISLNDSQDFTIAPFITSQRGEVLETEYRQRWNDGGFWVQPNVAYNPRGGDFNTLPQTYSSFRRRPVADRRHLESGLRRAGHLQRNLARTLQDLAGAAPAERRLCRRHQRAQPLRDHRLFLPGPSARRQQPGIPGRTPARRLYLHPRRRPLRRRFPPRFQHRDRLTRCRRGKPARNRGGQLETAARHIERPADHARWPDTRGDVYHIDNPQLGAVPTDSHFISRGLPYAAIDWRWPFLSSPPDSNVSYVFEPIAQVIAAPYGGNPPGIPNEDSTDFQFDETDIFSFNRSPGYDLVETGPRANVGFRTQMLYPSGSVELLVGQEFRLKPDPIFSADSGFSGTASDLVGRLTINFLPHFDFTERVDIDEGSGTLERNEVYIDAYYGRSSLEVSYLKVPEQEVSLGLPTREEVNAQALINVWENWMVYASGQRNLQSSTMIADEFRFWLRRRRMCRYFAVLPAHLHHGSQRSAVDGHPRALQSEDERRAAGSFPALPPAPLFAHRALTLRRNSLFCLRWATAIGGCAPTPDIATKRPIE